MAIFHLNVVAHSRSQGHSAVAGAAYRAGVCLVDDRTGLTCDYSHKKGVTGSFIVLPQGVAPMERKYLWDKVEAAETRTNSTIARDIEFALPFELNAESRKNIALGFTNWLVAEYGFAAELSLHDPTDKNDPKNFHGHIYVSTRELTANGFTKKVRILDSAKTGASEIKKWRHELANRINSALAENKIESRIDHRSNQDRGLIDIPTIHEGHGPQSARIKAQNNDIRELNQINRELAELLKERAELAAAEATERATTQATQDVAQALDSLEKTAQTPIEAVATQDIAGSPLTPAEIETLRQELAQPPAPTHQELQAALTHAEADATKARQTLPNAYRGHDIARAKAALPEAIEAAQAAIQSLAKVEHKLEDLPWWRPFKKRALLDALEQAKLLKQRTHDDMQELKVTAKAPDHDAIMADFLAAKERAKELKAILDAMPTKTQAPEPAELKRDVISALLLSDAARAAAVAKATIIDGKPK